jgi:hypothetical protein
MRLCENGQIVIGGVPIDLASAGITGDYVSLKLYKHVAIVFQKGAGASGEDPTITLYQATTVAGGSAKVLTFTDIYVKQGASMAAIGTFTKTTQTAASTYTSATAGEEEAVWVVEIDADELDVDGGFDCIRADISDVGSTSQIGNLLYVLTEPRYAAETMPSAIA